MPYSLRLATYNCENLFSRPRIFRQNAERSKELLGYVAELQQALANTVFDHQRIRALKSKLRGFATVNDLRGKHTSAAGSNEWLGTVELTRSESTDAAVENTARVIAEVNADLICLMEVENRDLLQQFHDGLLNRFAGAAAGQPCYPYVLLFDGNDDRRIDVALLSRRPIGWLRSHIHERSEYEGRQVPTFSRDCLEVQVLLPRRKRLYVLVNHFKSMGYSPKTDPQSHRRRLGQALRVAELVDQYALDEQYVVVAGDLNSDPTSPSLAPLVNHPKLYNVNLELPAAQRGTYSTGRKQLDYLFVSAALKPHLQSVYVERRGAFAKTKWKPFPTVTSKLSQGSDHGAVVADFAF
jgi:endonuclease/exonuclease/phosphatase family metal-dependent hydrolase